MLQEEPTDAASMRCGRDEETADVILHQPDEAEDGGPLHSNPVVRVRDVRA